MFIALHDPATNLIRSRTTSTRASRSTRRASPVGPGADVDASSRRGRPLRIGTHRGADGRGALSGRRLGHRVVARGRRSRPATASSASSPSRASEQDAFNEADERLLDTLAASMGVALENARLFDETKRLLAETDQRAAELAVINEIGRRSPSSSTSRRSSTSSASGSARSSTPQSMFIALHDPATNMIRVPVRQRRAASAIERRRCVELGRASRRRDHPDRPPGARRARTRRRAALGAIQVGGSDTESFLGVPILSGDRVIGVVALEQLEKDAFTRGRRAAADARWPRAWASRSRTPACSTRRSAC